MLKDDITSVVSGLGFSSDTSSVLIDKIVFLLENYNKQVIIRIADNEKIYSPQPISIESQLQSILRFFNIIFSITDDAIIIRGESDEFQSDHKLA